MVDQGPKGYCVPATFERAMRTMGIDADMYLLAMVGQRAGRRRPRQSATHNRDRRGRMMQRSRDLAEEGLRIEAFRMLLCRASTHRSQNLMWRAKRAVKLAEAPQQAAVGSRVSSVEGVSMILIDQHVQRLSRTGRPL
jgi:hypothetical protein